MLTADNMKHDPTLEFCESVRWLLPAPPSGQEQSGTPTRTPQCAYRGHGLQVQLEHKWNFIYIVFLLNVTGKGILGKCF